MLPRDESHEPNHLESSLLNQEVTRLKPLGITTPYSYGLTLKSSTNATHI